MRLSSYRWSSRDPERLVTAHRSERQGSDLARSYLIPKLVIFPLQPTAKRFCKAHQKCIHLLHTYPLPPGANVRPGAAELGKDGLNIRNPSLSSASKLPLDRGHDTGTCWASVSSLCTEIVLMALSSSDSQSCSANSLWWPIHSASPRLAARQEEGREEAAGKQGQSIAAKTEA